MPPAPPQLAKIHLTPAALATARLCGHSINTPYQYGRSGVVYKDVEYVWVCNDIIADAVWAPTEAINAAAFDADTLAEVEREAALAGRIEGITDDARIQAWLARWDAPRWRDHESNLPLNTFEDIEGRGTLLAKMGDLLEGCYKPLRAVLREIGRRHRIRTLGQLIDQFTERELMREPRFDAVCLRELRGIVDFDCGTSLREDPVVRYNCYGDPVIDHPQVIADLRNAVQLVLALHDHPDAVPPGHAVNLDPNAVKQLREAVAKAEGL